MCKKSLCPQLATFGNFQSFLLATKLKIGQKLAIYSTYICRRKDSWLNNYINDNNKCAYSYQSFRSRQANHKTANSWAHSVIANPKISQVFQSVNRNFYKIQQDTLPQNCPESRLLKRLLSWTNLNKSILCYFRKEKLLTYGSFKSAN